MAGSWNSCLKPAYRKEVRLLWSVGETPLHNQRPGSAQYLGATAWFAKKWEKIGFWNVGLPDWWAVSLAGGLLAFSRQDARCVSAVHFPGLPCYQNEHLSAKHFCFSEPVFSVGTMVSSAPFLRLLQFCFQAVKFPARVTWDATGGLFQARLRRHKLFRLIIPCSSFAKVLSAIIMSAESQACTQPVILEIH